MDKTSFGEEVYSVVASIPPGRVLTYGQIAYLIGKPQCSRMVGQAMHNARGCVKTLAQPFSIIYSPVIFSFVYAA
ncbi:MGMT family protein, partial [Bacteroides cellulosilyticus]|uniref:MGMT family protein n=1 Tax=Bacteroides cellulosilyticus TaxID=246787 RepID=UPI0034A32952